MNKPEKLTPNARHPQLLAVNEAVNYLIDEVEKLKRQAVKQAVVNTPAKASVKAPVRKAITKK